MSETKLYESAWREAMEAHRKHGPHIMLSRRLMKKFGFMEVWTKDGSRGWMFQGTMIQEIA